MCLAPGNNTIFIICMFQIDILGSDLFAYNLVQVPELMKLFLLATHIHFGPDNVGRIVGIQQPVVRA